MPQLTPDQIVLIAILGGGALLLLVVFPLALRRKKRQLLEMDDEGPERLEVHDDEDEDAEDPDAPEVDEPQADDAGDADEAPSEEPGPAPKSSAELASEGPPARSLAEGLSKTRRGLFGNLLDLLGGQRPVDDDVLDEVEELLFTADMGVNVASTLIEGARESLRGKSLSRADVINFFKGRVGDVIRSAQTPFAWSDHDPHVVMVVGVNGAGKTTSIGKLSQQLGEAGQQVVLGAADTFRAAAVDQLVAWGERTKTPVIADREGADPGSVAYNTLEAGKARGANVIIVDTAGRLHTQANLMEELKKVRRVMSKVIDDAPHEVWLVVDANTGQNAISQARLFNEAVGVTGLVLTKLDGTAKGGIVVGIADELGLPVRYIGVGEGVHDLRAFDTDEFVDALFAD